MAKKKSNKVGVVAVGSGLVGLLSVVLYLLLPVVGRDTAVIGKASHTGADVIFGYKYLVQEYDFNFLLFLIVLVGAIALVAAVVGGLNLAKKQTKIVKLVSAVLFVVVAVLVFSTLAILKYESNALVKYSLGVGVWVSGILSALAAVGVAYSVVKE